MESLNNKKIIVTGAYGNIGSVVARYLDSIGVNVVLFGREEQKLAKIRDSFKNPNAIIKGLDLTNSEEIKTAIKDVFELDHIKYSGLVHCAGGGKLLPLRILKKADMLAAMQINCFAFIDLVREITSKRFFDDGGGSIVALSSYAAMEGEKTQTAYSASKAALDATVRTLSHELAPKKIRINSIRPGMIESQAVSDLKDSAGEERFAQMVNKQLLGLGTPQDIAYMCAFLLSDESRFMTGRSIYLDGGRFG